MTRATNSKRLLTLTPLMGTVLFIVLYIVATLLYPGGSQADKNATGFSWIHNYWCNLLNENAINGKLNPARPVAMFAMFVLAITLAVFWILFAAIFNFSKPWKAAIALSGIIAMATAMFIFTTYHDVVINVAGVFGLVALTGTYIGLYKNRSYILFVMGLFNLVLIAVNNLLYYGPGLLRYLPVVQKITFLFFLTWICLIDVSLIAKLKKSTTVETVD